MECYQIGGLNRTFTVIFNAFTKLMAYRMFIYRAHPMRAIWFTVETNRAPYHCFVEENINFKLNNFCNMSSTSTFPFCVYIRFQKNLPCHKFSRNSSAHRYCNITCNCSGFSSSKICSHSLAIADKEQSLIKFLETFRMNFVKTANISTLANTGINRDVSGKKGQHNKTRRCTGQGENPSREEFRPLKIPSTLCLFPET